MPNKGENAFVQNNARKSEAIVTCRSDVISGFKYEDSHEITYRIADTHFAHGRFARAYRAVIYTEDNTKGTPAVVKKYDDKIAVQKSLHIYSELKQRGLTNLPLFYFGKRDGLDNMIFTEDLGGENGVTVSSMSMNEHYEAENLKITKIKNFTEAVKNAFENAKLATEKAVFLPEDAYLISFNKDGGDTNIRITIGDLYNQVRVYYPEYIQNEESVKTIERSVALNLSELRIAIQSFIQKFVVKDVQQEYLSTLDEVYNSLVE